MIFLVNDANILIDLLKIGLLEVFFQLDYDFLVTDMVLAEIQEKNVGDLHPFFNAKRLTRQGFTFDELVRIQVIQDRNPALSVPDCSCLYLAQKVSATLLTNDAALRRIAGQEAVPVHGILWVFDMLVEQNIIQRDTAIAALSRLMEVNPRLPEKECLKRLKLWESQPRGV
ncbi:MAG: hypothetical protein BWK76_02550 [Desulfobulbaceae bacterium A2]|nr:MAG: hypothetical protein BWK76_02550 [Desulfobulbaceae bacterium A2]